MAKQAEAESERSAILIHDDLECQEIKKLREAAYNIAGEPKALQFRFL